MRWLHISDIHFGYDSATVEKMREKLIQNAGDIGPVDCIFITGDLRYGKTEHTAYPPETLTFIQQLQAAYAVKPEDTFVVPGNHDVNRDDVLQAGIERAAQRYTTSDGTISEETLKYIRSQRQPFLDLYKEICGREEPDWHYCIQKDGFNIICLNTALFCCRDGEDGSLVVGSRLLHELGKKVDSSLPGIVLAHHDFEVLRQDEQQQLELTLKEMGAELYLCGHKHVALARTQNTYRADRELNVFLCGTSMDKDPNLEQTDMDIFVGQIDKTGKKGYVQAYKWNYRCHDWLLDVDFSYPQNKATDGRRFFPANARPQPPKPLNKNVLEKYRQYICAQCGEIDLNGLPINQEDAGRKYALGRIFVPLTFKQFKGRSEETVYEIPEIGPEAEVDIEEWLASYRKERKEIVLSELIPIEGNFRRFVLSDPGGGKTTLLKRIASVYSAQAECDAADENLPQRELFPIWIRCRDISVGGRPTVWNVIENVARLGEWAPGDSAPEDFISQVAYHIERGTALLLIDGLDEIGSDTDRRHFVDQLSIFAENNPSANMIVTTRITGFSVITREKFQGFEQFEISPLRKKDIESLCVKWYHIVYGESAESEERAKTLAERITGDERILRLARNPLLLTTLLLVERRVGKLPTKRTALYDEAIQVLLETWNQAGHEHEKVDLEEAKYQLSYVAFHMIINHAKRIGKTELHKLIREFRQNFSELVSQGESVSDFIKKIEKRSALLIQKGYEEVETGKTEAVYEFQHLTFQEYLAAYAVANRCCPGQREDNYGAELKPYLSDTSMKETIALSAKLERFCAKELADELIGRLASGAGFGERARLRALLLQFAADEVPLKDDVVDKIFAVCFQKILTNQDIKIIRQILEGRYKDKLVARFEQMDQENYGGYAHTVPISLILLKEVADPYQYYMEHRLSTSVQQVKAISVLGCATWVNSGQIFRKLDETQRSELKAELLAFLESDNRYVRAEALGILRVFWLRNEAEDMSQYIEGCIKYINDFKEKPPYLNEPLLALKLRDIRLETHAPVDREAFRKICAESRSDGVVPPEEYEELLGLALIAVVARADSECLTDIFSLLGEKKYDLVVCDHLLLGRLIHLDYRLSETTQHVILHDPSRYTEEQKRIIQKHILETDLKSAQQLKQQVEAGEDDGVFSYNDCSLLDGSSFSLSCTENSLDEVIEYITKRLEALHMTSEVTC